MTTHLHFDVSTGLKSVIGRDLITNDEVAIFELVKNSFDARAKTVYLYFFRNELIVVDDGHGMTYEDLRTKWLFVAYSSKNAKNLDATSSAEFRTQISERKHFAGSKGIGRFSSDRLGSELVLQTRKFDDPTRKVHQLRVDWSLFEQDANQQFDQIPIEYIEKDHFTLPEEIPNVNQGTAIKVLGSRITWDRFRILSLKASLAKLINPFGAATDGFQITIIAPEHLETDREIQDGGVDEDQYRHGEIVNGNVGNFIFSSLREKTTSISVELSKENLICSTLTDRGEIVYEIREPNPYPELLNSGFKCQIYYLNQSAKLTFARRMGLRSVSFGSIFLFRNGFRVYPIGEEGDDSFGIDRRKQQGYNRYLGSRDIIGRVDVEGTEEHFKEASSRNQGLVQTPAVTAMSLCFWEHCLKRLERYVVPVTWADSAEKTSEDLSRLMTDSGRARVTNAVAHLINSEDVEVIQYSKRLINVLNERSSQFETSIEGLKAIALKTNDSEMVESLERAEQRFFELKAAEAEALRIAVEERVAKEEAQRKAEEAAAHASRLDIILTEEKKRSLFLASITSLDTNNILNMHHQITIYAADLKQQIENCMAAAQSGPLSKDEIVSRLEQVAFLNQKVLSISRLAIKANFRLDSDKIEADLADYFETYIREGAAPFLGAGIELIVRNSAALKKRFRPIEASIVIDNLISNSRKAKATKIVFDISSTEKRNLVMTVSDNGRGFATSIDDANRVFELGFSRTSGSGLGLYHVKQALSEMNGSITVEPAPLGAKFLIKVTE
jgi:signal transduction histidine kinase